ncbi:GPR endopeptidase [Chakrabartyella piscis]|uniref:GPR endopeptidase n=1 Tax=Chakrabartyella piscis TaxID=2918914 RepID=UPI0029587941|nr:GPR endopeptidase [Chakrabartyella piscis]
MKNTKNIQKSIIKSDLAIEAAEIANESIDENSHLEGITITEKEGSDFLLTHVRVENKTGSIAVGKPIGTYITIESPFLKDNDLEHQEKMIGILASELQALSKVKENDKVLVVGLGNWNITPDALGPQVISKVFVTRHLEGCLPEEVEGKLCSVAAMSTGVMGITGIESGEIIKGLVERIHPSFVIAVDALAARRASRINATIQMSDTGVAPGAGVGNPRMVLNEESLGVPVIAIGVPTVVDAATLVNDTMSKILEEMIAQTDEGSEFYQTLINLEEVERYQMISELLDPYTENMFVTPKEVDSVIERLSYIIANGINIGLHKGITMEDIGRLS